MTNEVDKKYVEKIKSRYEAKPVEKTKLEEIKALDKKVRTPAKVFAYIYGALGALVLGTGMCLAMEIIGSLMPLGIAVGVVGIVMVSITYTIYKRMLEKRKAKYKDEILAKSDELLKEKH